MLQRLCEATGGALVLQAGYGPPLPNSLRLALARCTRFSLWLFLPLPSSG